MHAAETPINKGVYLTVCFFVVFYGGYYSAPNNQHTQINRFIFAVLVAFKSVKFVACLSPVNSPVLKKGVILALKVV